MAFSPLLDHLMKTLRCLPGVGPKSAQRMAFHLLQKDKMGAKALVQALEEALNKVGQCDVCRTLCEYARCQFCANVRRITGQLCVVESPADILAVEQSGHYHGAYFVRHGHLSPLDGVGPDDIGLPLLAQRLQQAPITELILALNPTVEGEATLHYIVDMVKHLSVKVSRIAYGIPIGGSLEYVDGGTIAQAIMDRTIL